MPLLGPDLNLVEFNQSQAVATVLPQTETKLQKPSCKSLGMSQTNLDKPGTDA